MLPGFKNTYESMSRTWKDNLFGATVRPVILVCGFITIIDVMRAMFRHRFSDLIPTGLLWLFVGPFLYLWWRRNK